MFDRPVYDVNKGSYNKNTKIKLGDFGLSYGRASTVDGGSSGPLTAGISASMRENSSHNNLSSLYSPRSHGPRSARFSISHSSHNNSSNAGNFSHSHFEFPNSNGIGGGGPTGGSSHNSLLTPMTNAHIRLNSTYDVTQEVGTAMYMAPELVDLCLSTSRESGNTTGNTNSVSTLGSLPAPNTHHKNRHHSSDSNKSDEPKNNITSAIDIYALGLIIVELFCDFDTNMGRVIGLTVIKSSDGDEKNFNNVGNLSRFPFVTELVSNMLKKDWKSRYTALGVYEYVKHDKKPLEYERSGS